MNIGEGLFFSKTNNGDIPVEVVVEGWRGTQAENKKGNADEAANIGTSEFARLATETSVLNIKFEMRPLALEYAIIDLREVDNSFSSALDRFNDDLVNNTSALTTIAIRMANNIVNARWAHRNRVVAANIIVNVDIDGKTFTFNALDFSLKSFEMDNPDINEIADYIVRGWKGEQLNSIKVYSEIDFGVHGSQVYPSQLYVSSAPKHAPSRLLRSRSNSYGVGQHASFNSTKIWNAIRTIDTDYSDYSVLKRPLPVEPTGASLQDGKKHRKNDNLKKYLKELDTLNPDTPEGKFVTICLIQGGVFSEGKN